MLFKEVKEIVNRKAKDKYDEYHSPGEIEFHHFNALTINNTVYRIAQSAKRLIGYRLGVQPAYIDRCPPILQAQNLNYWLNQLDVSQELFCRFEGSILRAIFTKRYKPIDHHEIINSLDVPDKVDCNRSQGTRQKLWSI